MDNMVTPPQTAVEAVTPGLYLAITAPTEEKSLKALAVAEEIVRGAKLTDHEIDTAKAIALAMSEVTDG